jgi:hypothetical protein
MRFVSNQNQNYVLTNMDVTVLLGVAPYILWERCKSFGETSSTLRNEILTSSERLVSINFPTRRHTPADNYFNILHVRTLPLTHTWYIHASCIDARVFAPFSLHQFSPNLGQSAVSQCYDPVTVVMQPIRLEISLLWGINELMIFSGFHERFLFERWTNFEILHLVELLVYFEMLSHSRWCHWTFSLT